MKVHEPLSTAKALLAFLILAIAFGVFFEFMTNQDYFTSDPTLLRNFVLLAIIAMALLIGLLYLGSQTVHKTSKKTAKIAVKVKSRSKSKKRR